MAVILAMTAIGGWAILSGRLSYVVTNGVSMNPVYYQNDLVVVLKDDSYQVGQIAAYHGSAGITVLHRIVGGDAVTGFVVKGDNNPSEDAIRPTAGELIGRAVLHVPKGGVWLRPLLSPTGLGMLGFLLVGGGAAATVTRRDIPRGRRKKKVRAMARQGGSWATMTTAARSVAGLPPPLRAVTAAVIVAAVLGLALGALGWAAPAVERQATGGGGSVTFSYSAKVRPSAAYDGTTVTAPDPVFRRLTDQVAVHTHYTGPPGSLFVTASLFNPAGWHTTIPLATPRRFTTNTIDSTVNLDLAALDKRAAAAATVIGVEPGPITMTITARVVGAGRPDFLAHLPLTLASQQLTLPGGTPSLTVTDPVSTTLTPREISFLGRPMLTAGAARSWAALLVIVAAAGAGALLLLARKAQPVRTREEIERRFTHLLVSVEPMSSPPGKPVVNVDNFPALVKLAERYGQMILTWQRPEADDFVVRDDGITYRYRVPLDEPPGLRNIEHPAEPLRESHRPETSPTMT